MCWERAAWTSAIAVACGTPIPSTPRVVQAAPGPTPTSTHGAGPHQVQAGRVAGTAADDAGHGHLGDELLEVERLDRRGHVLGGDHGPLNDQHVQSRVERHLVVVAHPLRRERSGCDHTLSLDLAEPLRAELSLDRLPVDLLHLAGGLLRR